MKAHECQSSFSGETTKGVNLCLKSANSLMILEILVTLQLLYKRKNKSIFILERN